MKVADVEYCTLPEVGTSILNFHIPWKPIDHFVMNRFSLVTLE